MTAKWRTKTGCLTCRKRRKKCDETSKGKSSCTACARNAITCIWPVQEQKLASNRITHEQSRQKPPLHVLRTPENTEDEGSDDIDAVLTVYESESDSSSPSDATPCTESLGWLTRNTLFKPSIWHGRRPDSVSRHELFNYYETTFTALCIRCDSHPGFFDWSFTISQALEHSCLMDTILACSAIHLARNRPHMLQLAYSYYSSAISKTRATIEAKEINGSEDWLLMMVCHLAIFERHQPESSSRPALHLQGAVYLMSLKRAKVGETSGTLVSIKPHERLYAESVIYNTSFSAFLSPDISWLADSNVWDQVDVFCTANPYPGSPDSSISPLVGVPVKICYLVLEASFLARRLPWDIDNFLRAVQVREDLDVWLVNAERDNRGDMGGHSWRGAKLFLFAADILLFKATESDVSASHPRIRRRVQQSLDLLKGENELGTYWNQHFCWPIAILACAVECSRDFLFLQYKLEMQWQRSFFGDVKRTANLLQAMWDEYYGFGSQMLSVDSMEDVGAQDDTTELLLRREGLCSILGS